MSEDGYNNSKIHTKQPLYFYYLCAKQSVTIIWHYRDHEQVPFFSLLNQLQHQCSVSNNRPHSHTFFAHNTHHRKNITNLKCSPEPSWTDGSISLKKVMYRFWMDEMNWLQCPWWWWWWRWAQLYARKWWNGYKYNNVDEGCLIWLIIIANKSVWSFAHHHSSFYIIYLFIIFWISPDLVWFASFHDFASHYAFEYFMTRTWDFCNSPAEDHLPNLRMYVYLPTSLLKQTLLPPTLGGSKLFL